MEDFGVDWSKAVVVTNERDAAQAGKVVTRFFRKAKLDKEASRAAGEPKWKDVDYVEMFIPGDTRNIVVKPVDKRIRALYRTRYEKWKAGEQDALEGTPVQHLPGLLPSQVEDLKHHKIRTIEDMAGISDEIIMRLGVGYRELSQRAQKYLERSKAGAQDEKLRAALSQKDAELESMRKRLEALEAGAKTEKQTRKAAG